MQTEITQADRDRFWSHVDKGDGCWLWTAHRSEQGYGVFSLAGKNRRAHRISYALHHGPIPAGQMVCHRCDTPACVRPGHLFLGTGRDNAADCIAKGRFPFRAKPGATHCKRGHEFTPENTMMSRGGKRGCRACRNARARSLWVPRSQRPRTAGVASPRRPQRG